MSDRGKNSFKCIDFNKVKNFKYVDEVCLINTCLNVEHILEVNCYVDILETEVIEICSEYYLIIKGIKILKVFYEASNSCTCGKVVCEKFIVPFFEKIKIECGSSIENISGFNSYCDFDTCGLYNIVFYIIITICIDGVRTIKCNKPLICCEEKEDFCEEEWNLHNDSIK